jgi:hypothetical protein
LEIGIFLDVLDQFFIGDAPASRDDQSAKRHAEWLGGRTIAFAELRRIVIFQVSPGDEFCQLDPAVITEGFAAKVQEETFKG